MNIINSIFVFIGTNALFSGEGTPVEKYLHRLEQRTTDCDVKKEDCGEELRFPDMPDPDTWEENFGNVNNVSKSDKDEGSKIGLGDTEGGLAGEKYGPGKKERGGDTNKQPDSVGKQNSDEEESRGNEESDEMEDLTDDDYYEDQNPDTDEEVTNDTQFPDMPDANALEGVAADSGTDEIEEDVAVEELENEMDEDNGGGEKTENESASGNGEKEGPDRGSQGGEPVDVNDLNNAGEHDVMATGERMDEQEETNEEEQKTNEERKHENENGDDSEREEEFDDEKKGEDTECTNESDSEDGNEDVECTDKEVSEQTQFPDMPDEDEQLESSNDAENDTETKEGDSENEKDTSVEVEPGEDKEKADEESNEGDDYSDASGSPEINIYVIFLDDE